MSAPIRHRDASVSAHSEMTGTYRSYGSLAHKGLGAESRGSGVYSIWPVMEAGAWWGGGWKSGHVPNTIKSCRH